MIAVLAAAGWAGPLDAPNPDDLGKYRCQEGGLAMLTPPALGDRKVGTNPAAPPGFPAGLQSKLQPIAPDALLKKAAKGAGSYPAPAVASLATAGQVVRRDCENRATTTDHYFVGCKTIVQCEVLATIAGVDQTFDRRPQVGARSAPVESAAEAIGLVWFLDTELFLPLTPQELADWQEESAEYSLVEPTIPWVEVEEYPKGWLVRAPRRITCGCSHDVVRYAYWVSVDGRSCPVSEPGAPIAIAKNPICVD